MSVDHYENFPVASFLVPAPLRGPIEVIYRFARSADDIAAMWKTWNIQPEQHVAFYCGTGWRASEAFMYARAMGWKNVSVYDGGWYEWSSHPQNPVSTGERGPESSR